MRRLTFIMLACLTIGACSTNNTVRDGRLEFEKDDRGNLVVERHELPGGKSLVNLFNLAAGLAPTR